MCEPVRSPQSRAERRVRRRLHLRRPLVTHPCRLYPVADQLADKVCTTMGTSYPGGKRSSRVKDLVDLVVLAHTQTVDLAELRKDVASGGNSRLVVARAGGHRAHQPKGQVIAEVDGDAAAPQMP